MLWSTFESASLVVACAGVVFAGWQWSTNRSRLKSELFDRRHAFYRAAQRLIGEAIETGTVAAETTSQFMIAVESARFVLNDDVAKYLESLYSQAVMLRALESGSILRKTELLTWFRDQPPVLNRMFEPFLKLAS